MMFSYLVWIKLNLTVEIKQGSTHLEQKYQNKI